MTFLAPVLAALALAAADSGISGSSQAMEAVQGAALNVSLFPADNWWNVDISTGPVEPASAEYIAFINNGGKRRLHPDLGGDAPTDEDPTACYGMPFAVVSGVKPSDLVAVQFRYSDESDGVDHANGVSFPFYPIPPQAATQPHWIEGGAPGHIDRRDREDRHLLIVDVERKHLYELYNVFYDSSARSWHAGSGAFFDLNTNDRRPEGWTSGDAAGLAILPGLVRFDEVYDPGVPEINHAFRVTVRATDGYVFPASHRAGSRAGALPMGARLRLKASVDVTHRTSDANLQKLFRAMQKHGLIVADNGSDMYITGTYDRRWNNDIVNPAFAAFTANDFEVIRLGYQSPVTPSFKGVQNLRAIVRGNVLELRWDGEVTALNYQVQAADRMQASPPWRSLAETGETSWSESVDTSALEQFYRVIPVPAR